MRRTRLLLLFWFLSFSPPAFAETYPQLALGGGYECIVILSNTTQSEWTGEFRIRTGAESTWTTPISVNGTDVTGAEFIPVALTPGGTQKFVFRGDEVVRAGYLEIEGNSFLENLGIAVSFFFNFLQDGRLADSTGVPSAEWRPRFTIPVEKGPNVNTGFAWSLAPGSDTDEVVATLFDENGLEVSSVILVLDGHLARFFDEVFQNVPPQFIGRLELKSGNSFYLTALRLESQESGFQLTSVPPR